MSLICFTSALSRKHVQAETAVLAWWLQEEGLVKVEAVDTGAVGGQASANHYLLLVKTILVSICTPVTKMFNQHVFVSHQ